MEFGEGELEQQGGEFTARLAGSVTVDFRQLFLPVIGGADEQYTYLVDPFEGLFVSDLQLYFIGMYLLSSLVHYRPQVWVHAVSRFSNAERPADDQALALVEAFMSGAQRQFDIATASALSKA